MRVVPFPVQTDNCAPRAAASVTERIPSEPVILWARCPWSDEITEYDRRNIALYARLLHDASEGALVDDLAIAVFRLGPSPRAREVVRSHLKRAEWIADTLLPYLGW